MRRALPLRALAILLAASGCKSAGGFVCETDEQCTPDDLGGVCESTGFCSFPDPGCASGRRYAGHAGGALANQCVDGGDIDADPADGVAGPDGATDGPPIRGDATDCIVSGAGCLELPTQALSVFEGAADQPADYACEPETIDPSAFPIELTGVVRDAFGSGPLAGAGVTVYREVLVTTVIAADAADASGIYDLILPSGSPDFIHWKLTDSGAVDSYVLNDILDLGDPSQTNKNFVIFTSSELDILAAEAVLTRSPSRTIYYADLYDCDGNGVEHAIGVLSTRSGVGDVLPDLVPDSTTIYLSNAYTPTPRSDRIETNRDGHFYVFEAQPPVAGQHYYLQAWGFLAQADVALGPGGLRLLSEFEVPTPFAAHVRVGMRTTEGPLP